MDMGTITPILITIFVWWFSTGAVLWLLGRSPSSYRLTAIVATVAMANAMILVVALRDQATPLGAYAGFAVGLTVWAWHEVMFLLGYVCGPRRTPCPPNLAIGPRFVASTQAIIHHELLIAGHAILLLAMSWGSANQIASLTFCVLWAMRVSAKLVVFFGAPNISDDFLPRHLRYLATYFHKEQWNAFFPIALAACLSVAILLGVQASAHPVGTFDHIGCVLLASLASLAVLEHIALVLPLPDAALWAWATGAARSTHDQPLAAERRNR